MKAQINTTYTVLRSDEAVTTVFYHE